MPKKKVNFIATKYKNRKTEVRFYTKSGERVAFDAVKKEPVKKRVEFFTEVKKRKSGQ